MRIGFACLWDRRPAGTWSHIPWNLRAAMRQHTDLADVGVELSAGTRHALTALHLRRRGGRVTSVWQQSRLTDAYCRRVLTGRAVRAGCDAVVQIQDLAPLPVPYLPFQDMSFDALLHVHETTGLPLYRKLSADALRRRRDRQVDVYARAAGVLAMSRWLADSLVNLSGVPAGKVHVVYPGISAHDPGRALPRRDRPRHRLLFVGREFDRKGGPQVVAAHALLRRDVDPQLTLTVAGPAAWPMRGPVPEGVDFRGDLSLAEVARLYDTHDLFVMPSRLEPLGIVFAEAAARGLPAIGRNAFAMPEIIEPGRTGALVDGDDPADLAAVIAGVLDDDDLYETCADNAASAAQRFSWDRAGRDAVAAVGAALGR